AHEACPLDYYRGMTPQAYLAPLASVQWGLRTLTKQSVPQSKVLFLPTYFTPFHQRAPSTEPTTATVSVFRAGRSPVSPQPPRSRRTQYCWRDLHRCRNDLSGSAVPEHHGLARFLTAHPLYAGMGLLIMEAIVSYFW